MSSEEATWQLVGVSSTQPCRKSTDPPERHCTLNLSMVRKSGKETYWPDLVLISLSALFCFWFKFTPRKSTAQTSGLHCITSAATTREARSEYPKDGISSEVESGRGPTDVGCSVG